MLALLLALTQPQLMLLIELTISPRREEGAVPANSQNRLQPPGGRRSTRAITLSDVAAMAGVSAQTVSRAIRLPNEVASDTLERVRDAVRATGYVPNLAASNLASNRSRLVATLIPSISTSVFAEMLTAAQAVLGTAGYQLVLGFTEYEDLLEEQLVRQLLGRRPDGVLLVGSTHTQAAAEMLRSADVPVVETWGWTDTPIDDLVGFSNQAATAELLTAMHAAGYHSPAFAGSLLPGDHRSRERIAGFRSAYAELYPEQEERFVDSSGLPLTLESGAQLLGIMTERYPEMDIAMFTTDIFANGAVLAATRRGTKVPDQLAITGFGDFELSSAIIPALTTVTVPTSKIGRLAAERLLAKMEGRARGSESIRVEYQLALRETS